MSHDVSVIGLYILDVLGRPVDAIPAGGNVEFIDEIRLTVAGTAGGTVVDLAKLGLNCLAVGAVGDDEKADFVLATLQRFGVDVTEMQRLKGIPTSSSILNIRRNGDRPALHARGASDHFEIADSALDAVLAPPIIHLGGTGLLAKLDGEPSRKLLAEAKHVVGRPRSIFWVPMMARLILLLLSFRISTTSCRRLRKRSKFRAQKKLKMPASSLLNGASSTASSLLVGMEFASWMHLARFCVSQHFRSKLSIRRVVVTRSMRALSRLCIARWM